MLINNRIKQIMAPLIPIDAVYYCEEDKSLFRSPVIYLALWDEDKLDENDCSVVTPCNISEDGFGSACEDSYNFLGYEFNKIEIEWDRGIAFIENQIRNRKGEG